MENNKNTVLVAVVSVLATITIVLVVACAFLFMNISSDRPTEETVLPEVQETQVQDEQITTMYVANVANSIYLRSAPEEKESNIITTIPVGTQVVWISDETPVFSKVSYGGKTGYVKRDYLSAKEPDKASSQGYTAYTSNTTIYKYMYVDNVKNSIYLRSSVAENSSNIITTIPVGTRVGFIEHANNDFSKINYNGTIGYAKTIYLSDYYYNRYTYLTVYNVKNSIYLRSAPYENPNNIICEIPVNSVVRFLGDASGGFYKISWDGYVGYAKAIYLR